VRVVINGRVKFLPIMILSDGPDGAWVSGLPDRVNVITVGQQFVSDGQRVDSVTDKGGRSS
jgi:multidrug efflux system membrane fusion protein